MEQETHFSEKSSSLLMLNDDCLLDIFNFLPLKDYVNLAETCRRLLGIAQQYRIFRNIKVVTQREFYYIRIYNSIQIVPENTRLSVIGTHGTRFDDLSILIQNLSKAKLEGIGRFPFQSLKELKLSREVFLKITDWQNIFTNNPGIENLEYVNGFCDDVDGKYMLKMIELLIMLPKLKSLKIKNMFESESTETEYLSESVSPFTYGSRKDYYEMSHQLLIELGKNLNLVEFEYFMAGERIDTLKSFRNLEVLSITAKPCQFHSKDIETRIFPAMLKQIKLCYIEVPCSVFLSIIKQLKFLEEFHIGDGEIYDDECGCKSFFQKYLSKSH